VNFKASHLAVMISRQMEQIRRAIRCDVSNRIADGVVPRPPAFWGELGEIGGNNARGGESTSISPGAAITGNGNTQPVKASGSSKRPYHHYQLIDMCTLGGR
jgi:hypothetical protein